MPSKLQIFNNYLLAPTTWHPTKGGKTAIITFNDDITETIGQDPTGELFSLISNRMLSAQYYPPDAVAFYRPPEQQTKPLNPGDRILQSAPLLPFINSPKLHSMSEIYIAEKTESTCTIGYVTTTNHYGRGIWTAQLKKDENSTLTLHVYSTACPNKLLFWLGLPYARYLQLRARNRAIQEFQALA